jgi:MraZ protein
VQTPFLYGEYELKIDEKNRLSVPSEIRKALNPEIYGDKFFVTLRNKVPWFYPELYYKYLVNAQIRPDITPDDDLLSYAQLKFALADKVDWDTQGRMGLPEKILRRSGLGKEVTLIGMQDHLELWDRGQWEIRRAKLDEDSADIEAKAKQALRRQPNDRPQELQG